MVNYFLNNGFGWKDVNCYINKSNIYGKIEYDPYIHRQGFKYHLKKIIPEFLKSLKNKISKI